MDGRGERVQLFGAFHVADRFRKAPERLKQKPIEVVGIQIVRVKLEGMSEVLLRSCPVPVIHVLDITLDYVGLSIPIVQFHSSASSRA